MQFVKKSTGFMTNASGIADELAQQCEGDRTHVHLLNGRAKCAEVYPDELCFRILTGLLQTMKRDGGIQEGRIGSMMAEEEEAGAWDDQAVEKLDWKMVQEARRDEIDQVKKHRVYIKAPIKESWDVSGKDPIKV